jgi:hypothetical protein
MESNFNFLEGHVFHDELIRAEKYLTVDPGGCANKMRIVLESSVKNVYAHVNHLSITAVKKSLYKKSTNLHDLINFVDFTELVDNNTLIRYLNEMRDVGNKGSHKVNYQKKDLIKYLSNLHLYLKWYSFEVLNKEVFDDFNFELLAYSKTDQKEIVKSNDENLQLEVALSKQEEELITDLKIIQEKEEEEQKVLIQKLETEDKEILFSSVGITELMGRIWGRVFVNFTYLNENYHAVKYFRPEPKATEKFKIGKGDFESIGLYTMFEKKHSELSKEEVLKGTYDKKLNLAGDFPARYGTPSLLLSKLITEIGEYFRLQEMTVKVEFKGHYYKKEDSKFRNILEVSVEDTPKDSPFELIVIMINPGGSKPLSNDSSNWGDSPSLYHGVSCKPDDTQHQIVKLMELKNWKKAVVLNLFDKCNVNSPEIIEHYTGSKNKREHLKESVFHEDRRTELESIFKLAADNAPILIGWGVSEKLSKIKASIFNNVLVPTGRQIVGWKTKDFQFYHPWPRKRDDIRDEWPSVIFEQLKNS